jgi:hypothetical protein
MNHSDEIPDPLFKKKLSVQVISRELTVSAVD